MSIEFALGSKQTRFGPVSDPKVLVIVRTRAGDRAYRFLIDTGADFSVAPRRLAEEAGLDWAALPVARIVGIEQGEVEARLGPLAIEIGGVALTVRAVHSSWAEPTSSTALCSPWISAVDGSSSKRASDAYAFLLHRVLLVRGWLYTCI